MTTASHLKAPQRAVAVTARVALRHVLGLDLRVAGASHLPSHPHIVAHNLVSPLDAFIVALALEEAGHASPVILLDYELARIPLLSWLLTSGALAVDDRVGPEGHDDPFSVATRALWDGHCVITAPEQVVSTSLEVLPVRTGPLRLAAASDSVLVPTAVFGGHRLFDGGKMRLRRRGAAVGVTFGVPTPPPDGPDELVMAQRMLQFDLEALLSQTLDDYPDREEGEAGATWWPACRGGGAPDLLDTLEATDAPTPTIELWADDRTVVDTRKALRSSTTQTAPDVATWVLDDEDDAPTRQASSPRPTVPPRDPLPEPEPLQAPMVDPSPPAPDSPVPAPAGGEPAPVSVPTASAPPPTEPPAPTAPAATAPATAPASAPPEPVRVDGMLSFDLPGMPRKILRRTRLEALGDGLLAVHVEADDTAMLREVTIDRRKDKTLFVGVLGDEYHVASGDLMVDVPAGTQATVVALRQIAQETDQ